MKKLLKSFIDFINKIFRHAVSMFVAVILFLYLPGDPTFIAIFTGVGVYVILKPIPVDFKYQLTGVILGFVIASIVNYLYLV